MLVSSITNKIPDAELFATVIFVVATLQLSSMTVPRKSELPTFSASTLTFKLASSSPCVFRKQVTDHKNNLRGYQSYCSCCAVQVMVCTHAGAVCHVFESELRLPKFCMYAPADLEALPPSTSMVTFDIAERPARSTPHNKSM